MGIYKAKAVKNVASKIFVVLTMNCLLGNPPILISKKINIITKLKIEPIEYARAMLSTPKL